MKSKKEKQNTYEEDYKKLMEYHQKPSNPCFQAPQWVNSGDFIIKFSLFREIPNSITSTDTSLINGY